MIWLVVVPVELLIFMCVNKLLAGTGDPAGMIYPARYGSGENSPPMTGMGILAVPNFYGGDGSGVAIPDGDLPIAILTAGCLAANQQQREAVAVEHERSRRVRGSAGGEAGNGTL